RLAAQGDPGKARDDAGRRPSGTTAVGFRPGEEVALVAQVAGLFMERSTTGTARSPASSISQSSAGVALARPATRLVGNCICRVLYWVATSLYSCRANPILFSVLVSSS